MGQAAGAVLKSRAGLSGFLLPGETLFEDHLPHFKGEETEAQRRPLIRSQNPKSGRLLAPWAGEESPFRGAA